MPWRDIDKIVSVNRQFKKRKIKFRRLNYVNKTEFKWSLYAREYQKLKNYHKLMLGTRLRDGDANCSRAMIFLQMPT